MGRPLKPLDEETIARLARIQCTNEEIAAICGCHRDTLHERFSDVIKRERESGKSSLRRLQWKSATKGNVTMQIWLGKQLLGQKDKVEHSADYGDDPDIPENDRRFVGPGRHPVEPGDQGGDDPA
jgi:hypothetical protein